MFKINSLYSWLLALLAIVFMIASIWVVYRLNPETSLANVAIFYACSGLFVLTAAALALFIFRQWFGVREMVRRHLTISLRQGAWIALLYVASMVLQSQGLFTWLNSAFLVIALTFLEVFFLYNEKNNNNI